jgi:hypothetical protein
MSRFKNLVAAVETAIPPRPRKVLAVVMPALLFLIVWALLNTNFNWRYPARPLQGGPWYLLPAVDVCILLGVYAVLGWWRRRPMVGATVATALFLTLVRLYRISDGLIHKNYYRDVALYVDLPLLPDLWRLMYMSVSLPKLLLGTLLLLVALVLFTALGFFALTYCQRYLARGWRERLVFVGVLAASFALTPLWPAVGEQVLVRYGLFGHSVAPDGVMQARFAASADRLRRKKSIQIRLVQEQLQTTPANLDRLKGADFLMFLVESYGSAVYRHRSMAASGCPAVEPFTNSLASKGYFIASRYLNSITYGGGSWFAHATLRTGVPVRDTLEYALVQRRNPPARTMASMFKEAGYRTVLVQPGTVRPWPEGLVHGFDQRIYSFHMGYTGPTFGWAPMPDQYTIHVAHQKEMANAKGPLFVEFGLVSSHAPWTPVPPTIPDWSKLEGGRIYNTTPSTRFNVSWTNMDEGGTAYMYTLCYDFDVMRRYISERIERNSFIVILGDHQPPGAITYDDPSWAVPLHVISKDRDLIDHFVANGYTPGMVPTDREPVPRMDSFLTHFLTMLSTPAPPTAKLSDNPDNPAPPSEPRP